MERENSEQLSRSDFYKLLLVPTALASLSVLITYYIFRIFGPVDTPIGCSWFVRTNPKFIIPMLGVFVLIAVLRFNQFRREWKKAVKQVEYVRKQGVVLK